MQDILLLGLVIYGVILTIGHLLNRTLRLPWMFTIVLLGMGLTAGGLFTETVQSAEFALLSRLGMLLFLFNIGLDLDFEQLRHLGAYIVGGDIVLTLVEGTAVGLFFYFLFPDFVGGSLLVAMVAGLAFGTVGEVILLAILKEFGVENTRFGQLALGIGVFDDVFEILTLSIVVMLPAMLGNTSTEGLWRTPLNMVLVLLGLVGAVLLSAGLGRYTRKWIARLKPGSFVVPFGIFFTAFGFIYFGSLQFNDMGTVSAIFAGIAVKQLLPGPAFQHFKQPVFFVANVFLGPFFFFGLGAKMSLQEIIANPWLVIAVAALSLIIRVGLSYGMFHKLLGKRESLVMGVGLTSKFNTSIITENLLLTAGLITPALYSVLMGAFILLKPIIVAGFSRGLASMAPEKAIEDIAANKAEEA